MSAKALPHSCAQVAIHRMVSRSGGGGPMRSGVVWCCGNLSILNDNFGALEGIKSSLIQKLILVPRIEGPTYHLSINRSAGLMRDPSTFPKRV